MLGGVIEARLDGMCRTERYGEKSQTREGQGPMGREEQIGIGTVRCERPRMDERRVWGEEKRY